MKRVVWLLAGMVVFVWLVSIAGAETRGNQHLVGSEKLSLGMPGWPIPDKSIPQHEPGRPSRADSYSTRLVRENERGVQQALEISGLDAMTADGLDPLAGSYRLVSKDALALGIYDVTNKGIDLRAFEESTIDPVPDSSLQLVPDAPTGHQSFDLAAGDLNGDGVDEQIAAWVDVATQHVMLAIGEMPGSDGVPSSEPAAAVSGDQIDLLVRGYDQALWHAHFDGATWGGWNNDAGGLLLSGPAIASRGDATFDALVVAADNQLYQRHWNGSGWAAWTSLPADDVFSSIPAWIGRPPELSAPSAVARGSEQLDVFRLAPDRTMRWNHFDGTAWNNWSSLGGMFASGPGAVLLADGRVQLFAVGVEGALWYLLSSGMGWEMDGSAYRWQRVAPDGIDPDVSLNSAPSAIQLPGGQIQVFVRGSDDGAWQVTYDDGWSAWTRLAGEIKINSRPAATWHVDESLLFALTVNGSLQLIDTVEPFETFPPPWLPACCLGAPIDTNIVSYNTALTNLVDQLNLLDIETGHFLGDGRQQIALAYTTQYGIGLQLFDIADGFRTLVPLGQHVADSKDYFPKLAVGEFDGDAPEEIALAFASRRGGVRVFEHPNFDGSQIAWLKEGTYKMPDYRMNDAISSIRVEQGWEACVYRDNPPGDARKCFTDGVVDDNLHDDVYDNTGGPVGDSISTVIVIAPESTSLFYWSMDFSDGIYNQRNAYVGVEIFDVDPQSPSPASQAAEYYEIVQTDWVHPAPERTLDIVAGDFDGTRNAQGHLNDELALIWDKTWWVGSGDHYVPHFHVIDVEPDAAVLSISDHGRELEWRYFGLPSWDTHPPYSAEINLAAGDFDGDGRDEIARTWPRGFDQGDWPDIYRDLQVLDWDSGWQEPASIQLPNWTTISFKDALVAGDLNLDLRDEIVFFDATTDMIRTYRYTPGTGIEPIIGGVESVPMGWNVPVLATGDFSGQSIRVGQPSYRRQYDVGKVIAIVNGPPKHEDVINGVLHNLNADDADTYSQFEQVVGDSTEVSVTAKKDWGVDSEFKLTIGDPEATHVTASLENSYGEHFEHTGGSIQSLTYQQTIGAITDDIVYYTRLAYDVWEYPVYDSLTNAPQGYMSVVWPFGGMQSVVEAADTCDGWYQPNHQLMNVWSYPSRPEQLLDRDGVDHDLYDAPVYTIGTEIVDFGLTFNEVSSESRSHEYELGFAAGLEAQIGGQEVGVNLGPLSFSSRMPSMFFSARGEYNQSEFSQWTTTTTEETSLSGYFTPIADGVNYRYAVEPYLYWSVDDYLVLDYVTDPSNQAFWSTSGDNYNKPDPAFIRPWADGQCDHLWPDAAYFSNDIRIDPPMASAGQLVTVTATIHNYSEIGNGLPPFNQAFKISFYQGDPDDGGSLIGENIVAVGELKSRAEKGSISRSIQWIAQGSGEQHIYAVIDPQGSLVEVHDENDSHINNNKGYGVLSMDAVEFIDVGQAIEKAYGDVVFQIGIPAPTATLYLPLNSWSENLRIDVRAVDAFENARGLGKPFDISVFKTDWEDPEPDFSFTPESGDPPAVILIDLIDYADADLAGFDEAELRLYRLQNSLWIEATCPGYGITRFASDDRLAVPICQAGTFILSDEPPLSAIYLPLINRSAASPDLGQFDVRLLADWK